MALKQEGSCPAEIALEVECCVLVVGEDHIFQLIGFHLGQSHLVCRLGPMSALVVLKCWPPGMELC